MIVYMEYLGKRWHPGRERVWDCEIRGWWLLGLFPLYRTYSFLR